MKNQLSQLLNAFALNFSDFVPIHTRPPKNVPITDFNNPYTNLFINHREFSQENLVFNAMKTANAKKNVCIDCCGIAACIVVSNLNAVNGFDCPPSAIVTAGKLHWVVWFLADKFDFEPWKQIQAEIAAKFGGKAKQFLPMPSYNLVKFSAVTESYSYKPIRLHSIRPHNRYNADALLNAAIITERKSVVTRKGELTYQKFVRLISETMKSAEIIKSAETNLGLKTRRSEALLKSAVTRNDIVIVKRGVYAPKSAETSEGLPIAA